MRPLVATIDLAAIRHNYSVAKRCAPGRQAFAVVKANAYGHGVREVVSALHEEADGFAVASLEEAAEVRAMHGEARILLLEGCFEASEYAIAAQLGLDLALQSTAQAEALIASELVRPLNVWLKLDSGMHRLGLDPVQFRAAHARLSALPQVAQIVMMSHFARADELDSPRTAEQLAVFAAASASLAGQTSLCNSPALLGWPQVRSDWARPGLMLYGADPFAQATATSAGLRPVMTLRSKIIAVRELAAGEPLGYGARFVAQAPTRVGVVAMGYADGYPQFAPNGTPVLIDGVRGQLIGRVSMDMLTVDLTAHPQAGVGSAVELWGSDIRLAELAPLCATSAYRLPCGLKRVPRQYQG